eukprot:523918-Pelagomonas_calceolata.AAC.1
MHAAGLGKRSLSFLLVPSSEEVKLNVRIDQRAGSLPCPLISSGGLSGWDIECITGVPLSWLTHNSFVLLSAAVS